MSSESLHAANDWMRHAGPFVPSGAKNESMRHVHLSRFPAPRPRKRDGARTTPKDPSTLNATRLPPWTCEESYQLEIVSLPMCGSSIPRARAGTRSHAPPVGSVDAHRAHGSPAHGPACIFWLVEVVDWFENRRAKRRKGGGSARARSEEGTSRRDSQRRRGQRCTG